MDFITAAYLFEKGHRENNFSEAFAKINHQFVKSQYKKCKELHQKEAITEEEFQQEIIELSQLYPNNFEVDGNGYTIIKKIDAIMPNRMAESLTQHKNVYVLYGYYSQYEHYGIFSKFMIDSLPEYDFDKLKVTFWYVFLGVILCFEIMEIPIDHKNTINEVRNKILAMPEVCTYTTDQ